MRRRQSQKRKINPDQVYNNVVVSKLINKVMIGGKKSTAEKIVYQSIKDASESLTVDPEKFIDQVIENSQPSKYTIPRRFGGTTYNIPQEITPEKRAPMAIKLIVESLRKEISSKGAKAHVVLTSILTQSFNNTGPVIAAKNELHNAWVRNEPFAHFKG